MIDHMQQRATLGREEARFMDDEYRTTMADVKDGTASLKAKAHQVRRYAAQLDSQLRGTLEGIDDQQRYIDLARAALDGRGYEQAEAQIKLIELSRRNIKTVETTLLGLIEEAAALDVDQVLAVSFESEEHKEAFAGMDADRLEQAFFRYHAKCVPFIRASISVSYIKRGVRLTKLVTLRPLFASTTTNRSTQS